MSKGIAAISFNNSRETVMKNNLPVVNLDQKAADAIRFFLVENDIQKPIRIDLCFKGCCDPSLELRVDKAKGDDLHVEVEGLTLEQRQK